MGFQTKNDDYIVDYYTSSTFCSTGDGLAEISRKQYLKMLLKVIELSKIYPHLANQYCYKT